MKVTVCYSVEYDLDIPDVIYDIIEGVTSTNLEKGHYWNAYANMKCGAIRDMCRFADGAEIQGVYNNEAAEYLWEND